jgi:shikimate dehydrogenase
MNPELYERYLAKKAKKLGISVEELKAQGASPIASESEEEKKEPQYVQQTIQEHLSAVEPEQNQVYSGMQPETVKTEVPSYVFGPSRMPETPSHQSQSFQNMQNFEIKDTRENKFALIGYPLGHSLSPIIHQAGFKSLGINATYEILETPPDTLVDRVKFLKNQNYKGFNVTIPLKLPISLFVNEVDKYADLARAVNTVKIEADKTLKGYNTDVIGFRSAIPKDINLKGEKVAILGTGGAAHAACIALTECNVSEIAFFTRNIPNSIDLMNYVRRQFPAITFNVYQIENIRHLGEYKMLVNTTPIGMLGKAGDMMPVEPKALETLNKDAVVYDVIYNPKKTVLIKEAEKLNLRTITGLDMLIYQAAAAQEIWFGDTQTNASPDFKDMKIAALEAL